ncbi:MAG TPA: hypothetical protein VHT23_09200 [Gemmatimonadaceae bacterium]|nr:hypothetical protein [Gemmatimonadaceae bacterium]
MPSEVSAEEAVRVATGKVAMDTESAARDELWPHAPRQPERKMRRERAVIEQGKM